MRTKTIMAFILSLMLFACASRWSTTSSEDVLLSNGALVKIDRITYFRQSGSDSSLGFGRGGDAREWSISLSPPNDSNQRVTWKVEDRIPIILDIDEKSGRLFIVGVNPISNGINIDRHWANGNQNPYYVYELDSQGWNEIEFHPGLVGKRSNLYVHFEHFYVKNPTPKDIGNMTLEDKARLEVIQENEIRSDKYKLKYRVIGDHMPSNSAVRND